LLGCVIAYVVTLRFGENAQETRIGIRDPMPEGVASDEDRGPCKHAIEEIERADCPDADEAEADV